MSQLGNNSQARAPGSFSPMVAPSWPALRKVESSSEDIGLKPIKPRLNTNIPQSHDTPSSAQVQQPRPLYALPQANNSASSLHNFSRPTPTTAAITSSSYGHTRSNATATSSTVAPKSSSESHRHGRKNSSTQGSFEAYLPTTANSKLSSMASPNTALSASQIAAQAAMQHQTHVRQRSQTVPTPQMDNGARRPSNRDPTSLPMLSLTEASGPRESGFNGQIYRNGLLGNESAAHTAANLAFPKSPVTSPGFPPAEYQEKEKEKLPKSEKSKVKLFSRPGKISISKDKETKVAVLASPNKIAFASTQRPNYSTGSMAEVQSPCPSLYSMANSSSATIRPVESEDKKVEKEKHKHHFLSRQKHKLSSKDDHHLPLSSAASNSKPMDPNAPSSLYNFNLPPSPGPATTSFSKSMSGLDLRHGGRALREKKKEEKSESALRESELSYPTSTSEWPGPSSLGSGATGGSAGYAPSTYGNDLMAYGLDKLVPDDAWAFLRARLLLVFEGEDLRVPVEEFNRLVNLHIQSTIRKRSATDIFQDLDDLFQTGFSYLDASLHRTSDERLIPHLVEMWIFTFTSVLPYMQAVFLPLDLELSNSNSSLFVVPTSSASTSTSASLPGPGISIGNAQEVSVRSMILRNYRDVVILPRFDTLKSLFSRLSLENISLPPPDPSIVSSIPDTSSVRPGTAMSLEPASASYGSQFTTLFDSGSNPSRSRAISNVSSHLSVESPGLTMGMSMSMSSAGVGGQCREREKNVEDSGKVLTEMVGRMLQCVGILESIGCNGGGGAEEEKMKELVKALKLNWLGRGRMGRDRRGLVGARVKVPVVFHPAGLGIKV